jgi:hypothetical protein
VVHRLLYLGKAHCTIVEAGMSHYVDKTLHEGISCNTKLALLSVTMFLCRVGKIFFNIVSDVDQCISENCLYIPYIVLVFSNMVPVVIGSFLVAYIEVSMR